jgi:hypothetical protein
LIDYLPQLPGADCGNQKSLSRHKNQAKNFLKRFHYWLYTDDKLIDLGATNVASIEFWTENYLMILLSTGYLLYSSIDEIKKTSPQTKVLDLFEKYMDLHLNIAGPGKAGIFEILSPSYTTHTQWSAF